MNDQYIRICEHRWGDKLYVVELNKAQWGWQWFDVQEYKYDPTRFRALYDNAWRTYTTYFLNEVLMRIQYEDKMWELRRRNA
jgi:hypothetical protein